MNVLIAVKKLAQSAERPSHLRGGVLPANNRERLDVIDMDLGWVKFLYEVVMGFFGGLMAIITALFAWRKKDAKAIADSMEALKKSNDTSIKSLTEKVEKEQHDQTDEIKEINDRLGRGQVRMTRIEEQLKHAPTAQQVSDLGKQIAALQASSRGVSATVEVIRDHLIKKGQK